MALRRSKGRWWCVGAMALVLRVTQGLADIFWVAGPLTVALILVGMGLADDPDAEGDVTEDAHDRARRRAYSRGLARALVRLNSP